MRYYSLIRYRHRVKPHLNNPEVCRVLQRDFNKYTRGRWDRQFLPGQMPHDYESCDWWCGDDQPYPIPEFWHYTRHAACHWIVNFSLELAQLVLPDRPWSIVSSQEHSTVWDRGTVLFDFNFQAMGISADNAFTRATRKGKVMEPGKRLRVGHPENAMVEHQRVLANRAN